MMAGGASAGRHGGGHSAEHDDTKHPVIPEPSEPSEPSEPVKNDVKPDPYAASKPTPQRPSPGEDDGSVPSPSRRLGFVAFVDSLPSSKVTRGATPA
jgi:hypothetical protein